MKPSILLFVILLLFTAFLSAQSSSQKQLSRKISQLIADRYQSIAPGCAVLVSEKGKIIYREGFGTANLELGVPVKEDMVFRIGSITKQFTAVAVLQLVEQGKIGLQDSIQKFIRDFPFKGHTITIENLLTQTSGITDYLNLETNLPNPFRIDFPTKFVIDSLKNLPLEFVPASKFAYSNSNYFLLGHIIEIVTGKSYADYLEQNIFVPLKMTNTCYESPSKIIANRVNGYEKDGNNYRNSDFISMSLFYSAGGLMTNVNDLFKWNEALRNYKLVKKETLEMAWTPFKLSNGEISEYGYGWFLRELEGSKSIEHGGSIYGFRAEAIYLPTEDIYIAGLFNCRQLNNDEQQLCYDIARLMMGKSLLKETKLSDAVLDRYVGTYRYAGADTSIKTTITIYTENGKLFADLSNGTGSHMALMPQTETRFILAIRKRATCDFIIENGKTTLQVRIQQETTPFKKIE